MVYISSLLSDEAFDPRYHKTFKTTSIPEHIKQRIRRRCVIRPSVRLPRDSDSEDPPPPLAEILFARRPYLSDVLVEHGKCAGLGPSSVTEILEPIAEGPIPSHDRLALERLAFVAYGLMYELRKPKGLSPSRRRELQGQRVTDSIASRMEEDFVRGLGIATPIEPFTKEELFQYLIESLWIWVQDDRCKIELLDFIRQFLQSRGVIFFMLQLALPVHSIQS